MSNEPFSLPDSEEDHMDRLFRKIGTLSKLVSQRATAAESQSGSSENELVNSVLANLPESEDGSSGSITAIFHNLLQRISRSIPMPREDHIEALLQDDDESVSESEDLQTPAEDLAGTATLTVIEDNLTTVIAIPSGPSGNAVASSSDEPATAEVEPPASTEASPAPEVQGLASVPDSAEPSTSLQRTFRRSSWERDPSQTSTPDSKLMYPVVYSEVAGGYIHAVKVCPPDGQIECEFMEGDDPKIAPGGLDDLLLPVEEKEAGLVQGSDATATEGPLGDEKTVDEETGDSHVVQSLTRDGDADKGDAVTASSKPGGADLKASDSGHPASDKVIDTVGSVVEAPKPKTGKGKGKGRKRDRDESHDDGRNTKVPKLNTEGDLSRDARPSATEPWSSVPKRFKTFKELKESLLESESLP